MAGITTVNTISITELPKKDISSVVYELKVPNFFTRPELEGTSFKVKSPSFEFANSKWCLEFVPGDYYDSDIDEEDEEDEDEMDDEFEIKVFSAYLVRLNFENPKQMIFHSIIITDAGEKECTGYSDAQYFSKEEDKVFLRSFDNKNIPNNGHDTLTLIINLFYVQSAELNADQTTITMDRGMISLCEALKDVLLHGKDHNVTFDVRDKKFTAHQDILKARSEVFSSMLSHDMLEKNSGVVEVPDCDPKAFEQLLNYVYTGKVESLDVNNMFDLYYAADKYRLPHLREECSKFIKKSITISNVCDALELASRHCDIDLMDSASNYFFRNADDILVTVEWQNFMAANLTVANELFIKILKLRPNVLQ